MSEYLVACAQSAAQQGICVQAGIHWVTHTHVGHVRKENQDVAVAMPSQQLFMLADGMGGRPGGKLAADIATISIANHVSAQAHPINFEEACIQLKEACWIANQEILSKSEQEQAYRGMGTTMVLLWVLEDQVVVAHVGDSRAYRCRNLRCLPLTEDHLTPHPTQKGRWMLSRVLGVSPGVRVSLHSWNYKKKDVFLLCSDGLSGALSDEEIGEHIRNAPDLVTCSQTMVQSVLDRGGKDNVTVILIGL